MLADQARASGHEIVGFVDDLREAPGVVGTFVEARRAYDPHHHGFVLAIGYRHLAARWNAYRRVVEAGYALPALVHPRAVVHPDALVGAGSVVMEGAIVSLGARLGEACVMWPGATLSHHSRLGDNVFLSR